MVAEIMFPACTPNSASALCELQPAAGRNRHFCSEITGKNPPPEAAKITNRLFVVPGLAGSSVKYPSPS
jgi:hypothetical protein